MKMDMKHETIERWHGLWSVLDAFRFLSTKWKQQYQHKKKVESF